MLALLEGIHSCIWVLFFLSRFKGLGRCCDLWTSPVGAVIHRSITCHRLLDLVVRMASPMVKPILYEHLQWVLLGSDVIKFLIEIVIIYFIKLC